MEEQQEKEFSARPYQIYLYEKALEENSIIYLPTGSGKTFIAVLLIKRLGHAIQKSYSEGGKRTVFIVNTVALVIQQSAFISRHTNFTCRGYTGDMNVDFWTDEEWLKEINENQIMVMTAQIFLNIITHGIMPLSRVNLIIFDECHRAVKNQPMRQIMQQFKNCPREVHPRVLAMSASLLNANVSFQKVELTLKELEITFHSKITTVESLDIVTNYSTKPQEFVEFHNPLPSSSIIDEISKIITTATTTLSHLYLPSKMTNEASSSEFQPDKKNDKLKRILNDIKEHITEMGIFGGAQSILFHLIQLEYVKKYTDEENVVAVLNYVITQLMIIQKMLEDEMTNSLPLDFINKFSSPKVLKLAEILKNFHDNLPKDTKFCTIIFVQRRFTAKVLNHILMKLSEMDSDFSFLKPNFIIGYNNDPYRNAREGLVLSKWNKDALAKFRNGRSNCMIATDVVDEGVDIPSCTLVVRYYAPMDFRSYVQSKGRARHATSKFIILASSREDYVSRYKHFVEIEKLLQNLHGKTDRNKPSIYEIDRVLYDYNTPPYVINLENGQQCVITEHNAISIINIFCASLFKSKFIMLTPTWVKKVVTTHLGTMYKVHLTLPPICALRDTFIGDQMENIDAAKRSAAFKACIALYEQGELDDKLMPKKVEDVAIHAAHLFPYMEVEEKDSDAIPGTNSKKRRHDRIHAEELYGAYPKAGSKLYLHIIQMKPNYAKPITDSRHLVFYNLLDSPYNYAILSSKRMPPIPSFPAFMNVGNLIITVKVNNNMSKLTDIEINKLKAFHYLVFNKVLDVIKEFMVFDNENRENCFLVVPVNEKQQIDWDVVHRYKTIVNIPPSKPLVVKTCDYELALVTPNYRASNNYIVTEICEYLQANSSFPTSDFISYVHYFKARHDLKIEEPSQPMLEVKPISTRINCIKPRRVKANLSKRKRESLTENFEEHLVPELVDRIDFSALYWLKGTVLPSVLHRISQLLVAENFRLKIAHEAKLGFNTLVTDHEWQPLQIEDTIQASETSSECNLDESNLDDNDVDVSSVDTSVIEIDILSEEKSIYSWVGKEKEPIDLDRNADKIQLIDIEYYYQFMSGVTNEDKTNLKFQNARKSNYLSASKVSVPNLKMLTITNPYGPSPADILESLTTKMCNDAFNLERVETLGDSFLKFTVTLYLFQVYVTFGEGPLTYLKGKLVGNLNLYYLSKQKCIPGRMNVEEFSPKSNFITPSYAIERNLQKLLIDFKVPANILYELKIPIEERFCGRISCSTLEKIQTKVLDWPEDKGQQTGMEHFLGMQVVSDKSASDCVEALIGTYLLNLGIEGALKILIWLEVLPKTLDIKEYLYSEVSNPQVENGDVNELASFADTIEKNLGYKFKNRAFLLQAFTHPSYIGNRMTPSYQRLEFLGDAILDFVLTVHIYEKCGNLNPGELTDLRSALVNNITFACLAVRYGLHTALLAFAPKLFDIIDRFVRFQEDRNHEINDELLWVLLEEDECNMAEHVDVPKVLGDIYESVIGAIFLDCGKDLNIVWHVIYTLMHKEIDLFSKNVPKQPIRVIHETQGANAQFSKTKVVEGTQTVMVTLTINSGGKKKHFHGFGSTKKLAKCAASKQALKHLRYKH